MCPSALRARHRPTVADGQVRRLVAARRDVLLRSIGAVVADKPRVAPGGLRCRLARRVRRIDGLRRCARHGSGRRIDGRVPTHRAVAGGVQRERDGASEVPAGRRADRRRGRPRLAAQDVTVLSTISSRPVASAWRRNIVSYPYPSSAWAAAARGRPHGAQGAQEPNGRSTVRLPHFTA